MISSAVRPARHEAGEYYFKYIDLVPDGDICETLAQQRADTLAFLRSIPEDKAPYRYAAGKWSVNGVLAHLNDCERLFAFRAFWFARGFDSALPSFDQDIAASHDGADDRPLGAHIQEFDVIRRSSLELFTHLSAAAWLRQGVASGNPFTVRALAFIAAGHVMHHSRILRERYLG
jgi:hypothetical protein